METLFSYITPDVLYTASACIGILVLTGICYLLKMFAAKTKNEADDQAVDKLIKNLEEAKKKIKK